MATNDETQVNKSTIIEEGTEISGRIKSAVPLVVKGKIEGELDAPAVTVATTGALTGRAKVGKLVSEGELTGQFDADTVRLAGRVGNKTSIRARTLEAKLASERSLEVTFGETNLAVGEEPRAPEVKVDKPADKDKKPAAK